MNFVSSLLESKRFLPIYLVVHFCVWMTLSLFLDMHPDMSDHWMWSRYLSFGYYEHPPMIAYLMRLVTLPFPDPVIGLKLGAVSASVVILSLYWAIARDLWNLRVANMGLLALATTPYFSFGSVFWHIDQPFMFFWLFGLWSMARYLRTEQTKWFWLFGVFAGLGAWAKYSMLLLYITVGAFCLGNRRYRPYLWKGKTYAVGALSFLLFFPVFYWNASHDWLSFSYQFGRGLSGGDPLRSFTQFLFGHLALFALPLTGCFWWFFFRSQFKKMDAVSQLFLYAGLVPTVLFTLASLRGKVADPHWMNIAYISVFLPLFSLLEKNTRLFGRLVISSAAISFVALILYLTQMHTGFLNLAPENDPTTDTHGWQQTAEAVTTLSQQKIHHTPPYLVTLGYQLAPAIAVYMDHKPYSYSFFKKERNLWSSPEDIQDKGALAVCAPPNCRHLEYGIEKSLELKFTVLGRVEIKNQFKNIRTLDVYYIHRQKEEPVNE